MSREDYYIIPENFKKGNYLFNRFRGIDLAIIISCSVVGLFVILSILFLASSLKSLVMGIVGVVIGVLIISCGLLLTFNVPYYHNVLGRLLCIIRFMSKPKKFKWKGVDYRLYED